MSVIKTLKNGVWTPVSSIVDLPVATLITNGLMSSVDKSKLDKTEVRELLWTNPNPTSVFAPQTIALDLSGYDEVEISYLQNNSWGGRIEYHRATVGTSSGSHAQAHQINAERSYSISNNGITFNVGRKYATYGGAPTDDNSYMIPQKIYGIKVG